MAEGSQNNSSVCNHSCAEEEDPSNNVEPSIAADNSAEGSDHLRTAAHLCNEAIAVLQTKVTTGWAFHRSLSNQHDHNH